MNNITDIKKNECCGCTACMCICPKGAITMESDNEGFLYPKVDENLCINCGLCLKACKNKTNFLTKVEDIKCYAAKNKDILVLKKSSSGGISNALSEYFIKNNGVVYGVVYDDSHKVIIEREDNLEKVEKLYGSKYVQANPKQTFSEVYNDLKNDKLVLFISTSCYVAGLKSYLSLKKCNIDNLFTVDLICHGTPSPKLFEDYINYLNKKYNFDHFEFRTKNLPWGYGSSNFGCTIFLKNGKQITNSVDSLLYLQLFFSNYCLRPYCYNCQFSKIEKPSDITIADYWGLKEEHPDFFDENGVSALIVHSEKGNNLLKKLNSIEFIETDIEKIKKKQPNLSQPPKIKNDRDIFWKIYNEEGFISICKKYSILNFKGKIGNSKAYKLYNNIKNKITKK